MRNISSLLLLAAALSASTFAANEQRQAEVAARGPDVMPFRLGATTHVFTKTADGGTQRVISKNPKDATQTELVRRHLHDIRGQFQRGDFSGPSHIHGAGMPGLGELRAAKPREILITYRDAEGGAELTYRTHDPHLVVALHKWFDAQLSDHGSDAMEGHDQDHMSHSAPDD